MSDEFRERTAAQVMTEDPVCVDEMTGLEEIVKLLELQLVSGLPVLDGHGRVVGIVSKTDVLAHLVSVEAPAIPSGRAGPHEVGRIHPVVDWTVTARDLVRDPPVTAEPSDRVQTLARMMSQELIHRVVIVDPDRRPVGIVTALDLVAGLAN